jgi:virginiamycin B lyase
MNKYPSALFFSVMCALMCAVSWSSDAGILPGYGEITGAVPVPKGVIVPVYLRSLERNMGYEVFAVNGHYRAVDLLPGHYEITIRKNGFDLPATTVEVAANGKTVANLPVKRVPEVPDYILGTWYPDTVPAAYESIYPPGPGRDIAERTCMVCHTVNFLPNKQLDREGWQTMVDLMTVQPAFAGFGGLTHGPTMFDAAKRLPPKDKDTLLDYLAANFGPDSTPRSVIQGPEPEDPVALAKAEFIEYRYPSTKERPHRWTQELHFDHQGNVLIAERSKPAGIIKLDASTGTSQDFWGPKYMPDPDMTPHGLTVDKDDTVWWSGANAIVVHMDLVAGLTDQYVNPWTGMQATTDALTSQGDLWMAHLLSSRISHYDRKTNKISYWETKDPRSRPYGLVVDHEDRPWFAEYHTDYVSSFDLATQTFKRYPIKTHPAQIRRLGVDHEDIVWYGVYGCICKRGKIGRLDPKTGDVQEWEIPLDYADPYDVQADEQDNLWMPMDNHLVKFDPKTKHFTIYRFPMRSDSPKISITRENAVWFLPRSAGVTGNYGAGAAVLYPDKDKITELKAFYSPRSAEDNMHAYTGAPVKVTGTVYETLQGPNNPGYSEIHIEGPPNDWRHRDWTKGPSKARGSAD